MIYILYEIFNDITFNIIKYLQHPLSIIISDAFRNKQIKIKCITCNKRKPFFNLFDDYDNGLNYVVYRTMKRKTIKDHLSVHFCLDYIYK